MQEPDAAVVNVIIIVSGESSTLFHTNKYISSFAMIEDYFPNVCEIQGPRMNIGGVQA